MINIPTELASDIGALRFVSEKKTRTGLRNALFLLGMTDTFCKQPYLFIHG